MTLKEIRSEYGVSQQRAASAAGMPLRTYIRYEMDENYGDPLKRKMIVETIKEKCQINETKGVLTVKSIVEKVGDILKDYDKETFDFCYLFGSYAKGYALEVSDVNLLLSGAFTDEEYEELEKRIHAALHKTISITKLSEAVGNQELLKEVLKVGIRIHG